MMDTRITFHKNQGKYAWFVASKHIAANDALAILKKEQYKTCENVLQEKDELVSFVKENKETRIIILSLPLGTECVTSKIEDASVSDNFLYGMKEKGYLSTFTGNRALVTIAAGDYIIVEKDC